MRFKGRGTKARFRGKLPSIYSRLVSASEDPEAFASGDKPLVMEDFCLHDLQVWFPEALHKRYYPHARPPCPWHGGCDCVIIQGWVQSPRHCYGKKRVVALMGKRYRCNIRKAEEQHPFYFRGYDKEVIAASNDYIKLQWKKNGFDISHRAAISWGVLEDLRAKMNQALSVSGFCESMIESAQNHALVLAAQWQSYIQLL